MKQKPFNGSLFRLDFIDFLCTVVRFVAKWWVTVKDAAKNWKWKSWPIYSFYATQLELGCQIATKDSAADTFRLFFSRWLLKEFLDYLWLVGQTSN